MGPLKASTSHSVPLTKDDDCHPALSNPPPASLQVASSKVSLVLPRRSGGRRSCDCCNALAPPRPDPRPKSHCHPCACLRQCFAIRDTDLCRSRSVRIPCTPASALHPGWPQRWNPVLSSSWCNPLLSLFTLALALSPPC